MDRRVSIRFYDVDRHNQNDPTLANVLREISEVERLTDREKDLDEDFRLRLERLEDDQNGSAIMGEITRIQTTNFPSEVHPDGTQPLSVGGPLGHGIIFRYNIEHGVIGIQHEPRVASLSRFLDYLNQMFSGANFDVRPKVREDQWRRFNDGATRKLKIRVASPRDLAAVEGVNQTTTSGIAQLAQTYNAPEITVEVSMGQRKGALSDAARHTVQGLLRLASLNQIDLRGMKATTKTAEGVPSEEIDFLEELVKETDRLELPDNDPARSYEIRKSFIKTAMRKHNW